MTDSTVTSTEHRLLIIPADAERAGTVYENAHAGTVQAAQDAGFHVLTDDDGTATDVVMVEMTSPEALAQVLDKNPNLSWVQFPFAGVEPYIPVARKYPHITFTSAKGTYAPPVAEHALALTLALMRDLPTRAAATSWGEKYGQTLNGSNVLIIGGGGIGSELVRIFSVFDTHITVVRRQDLPLEGADVTVTSEQLDEVLPEADVVIVAAAATSDTHQLISAPQLKAMKPTAVLVNIARGTLVDTQDLTDALANEWILGAGLDVTDPEPLPDGHPLWTLPNALITPHSADTPEMCIPLLDERISANIALRARGANPDSLEGLVDLDAGY